MIDWLKNNIGDFIHKVESLGRAVLSGFLGVWNVFAGLMHVLRMVFGDLSAIVLTFIDELTDSIRSLVENAKWVVTVLVPRTIRYLLDQAQKLANAVGSAVMGYAHRLADYVMGKLTEATRALTSFIDNVKSWLWGWISPVVDWVRRYANRAVDIVLHPNKLAEWLLPALWGPLWRYLQSKDVPIGRWILGRSISAVLSGAGMIESVIAKLI